MQWGVGLQSTANYSLIPKQIEFRLNFWTPLWQKLTSCPWACCYIYDIFLFVFNVYSTLNTRDTLSVRPHFHILTLLWSKSMWLDERLGVWLRLVPWKIGLSPVQADWGRVTAGNSNVTPTLAVKNAQCPRGVALFSWVGVLNTGGTLYSARIGVCLTWICIGDGWPAGWNRVVQRRSS